MKNAFLISVLSFVLFACGEEKTEAQVGQYTTIEVEEVYNAGSVAKGEIIEAKIEVKNTGDYPLMIANVSASCACTVSEFDEDAIQPGETTTVVATVDTDKTGKGRINKPISISANTRPSRTVISIQATVLD
ncbi:DUF1573 domain-containing protein [Brumimicrobium aurantiacum]|nr:DUF1573 domain-containing protein [Brumimicrobium aurantiacum]